jgi:hypothetical protein
MGIGGLRRDLPSFYFSPLLWPPCPLLNKMPNPKRLDVVAGEDNNARAWRQHLNQHLGLGTLAVQIMWAYVSVLDETLLVSDGVKAVSSRECRACEKRC